MMTDLDSLPRRRRARRVLSFATATAVIAGFAVGWPTTGAADPTDTQAAVGCSAEDFNAGVCLIGMPRPGQSGLAAAVEAAVRSGRTDVVDKYASQPSVPESTRVEIRTAQNAAERAPADAPEARSDGVIVPFGGTDGAITDQKAWEINDVLPIERCGSSGGCQVVDVVDINFSLNLYFTNVATMYGQFRSREQVGTFGVKNFSCEVKKDNRPIRRDPVRGRFSTCVGSPTTKTLPIGESSVSHSYFDELNWLNIKFESYDGQTGVSFGNFEYRSPNWTKYSNGSQDFY